MIPNERPISSEPTAPSTMHDASSVGVEEWFSDDSQSVHSFESDHRWHTPVYEYLSTNLITGCNITLADVITEEATPGIIHQRMEVAAAKARFRSNPFGVVDPRAELKLRQHKGPVYTMVPYDEVVALSSMAERIWMWPLESHC